MESLTPGLATIHTTCCGLAALLSTLAFTPWAGQGNFHLQSVNATNLGQEKNMTKIMVHAMDKIKNSKKLYI